MPNSDPEPTYQFFNMIDYDRNSLQLVDITYLEEMFDLEVENERGKPIRITLVEKPESLTKHL